MGSFIREHEQRANQPQFGGAAVTTALADPESMIAEIFPYLRGALSSTRRVIGHVDASDEARTFANSTWAEELCRLGTSCPDHFLRTRISPMFVPWDPAAEDVAKLRDRIADGVTRYREEYAAYYETFAEPGSPALRDANPSVVVVPGIGLFGFGKDKREARITTEFFVNAIHVMAGANALEDRPVERSCRRSGPIRRRTSGRSTTTSRCHGARRSASSTGRSRRRSCSGCRRRRNSAARSSSSSAAGAASAGRPRCRSRSAGGTSSWPT